MRVFTAWPPLAVMKGLFLLLLSAGVGFLLSAPHLLTAQTKPPIHQAFPRADACKGCHERVFEEWETSPYARSIHSPAFRVLLAEYLAFSGGHATGFCFDCHAPHLRDYQDQTARLIDEIQSGDLTFDGVGCSQCHQITDLGLEGHRATITFELGRTMFGPYERAVRNLAHQSVKSDLFAQPRFCLTCHQPPTTVAVLDTEADLLGNWQAPKTSEAGKTCQNCHMPQKFAESANGQEKRSVYDHTLTGRQGTVRQPAAVLELTPTVQGDQTTLEVTVRNLAPHTLPMVHPGWAQLVLDLTIKGKNLKKVYGEQRRYGRRYADARGQETVFDFAATKVLGDTRLKPEEVRIETFTFPTPTDTRSFDAEVVLLYAPVSGPPEFVHKVEAVAPRGADDPAFQPIHLVKKTLNTPLK